jgi:hypothetical protein|tara:strand:+ start:1795 stop:2034 length:240 start_codon:yes stop_codon:yes gene_type:complete
MRSAVVACVLIAGCSSLPPVAKSAMDLLLPVAADALTDAVRDAYSAEPDESTAVCFPLPAEAVGDDGYVYVVCRAKAVE